jgi:transitional endoplasmic reticulum ATPase
MAAMTGLSVAAVEAVLAANKQERDPDIIYDGKHITLPGDPTKMKLKDAITTLKRKMEDEEQKTVLVEAIDAYPMDGAVSFYRAMKAIYGWASPVPIPGFFGDKPPAMRSIRIGPDDGDVIQVPWGRFVLPNLDGGFVQTSAEHDGTKWVFQIFAEVKKKDSDVIRELADKTRELLKTESIYRGKAIRLRTDDDGDMDIDLDPEFLHTKHIKFEELILNAGEGEQIETSLWTAIKHTKACVGAQIPLKRGILLEGPYGCGKALVASQTSRICVDHGWTFILLDNVKGLQDALLFAQRYAPAVVFAEDADRVAGDREERGNDLLNTIDGILSKNAQVITVLTTNYVEKLHPAMLRPGRLDAVISVRPPESESVRKLIRIYGRGLLDVSCDLQDVSDELAGNIPATIREVVERSKLAMISRGGASITPDDLLVAARGMKQHLALLAPKAKEESPHERLGKALTEVMMDKMGDNLVYLRTKVDATHELAEEIRDAI